MNGDKLKGKKLILSFTTGASEEMYHKDESLGYEIEDLLLGVKSTCKLCGIDFLGFVYIGGVSYRMRNDKEMLNQMEQKAIKHADKLITMINNIE